jgi:hypothetical protein
MRFHVAGSATREIVIETADEQKLTEKLTTGDQVVKGAVKIIKITGN